jgi:hypothetical protein
MSKLPPVIDPSDLAKGMDADKVLVNKSEKGAAAQQQPGAEGGEVKGPSKKDLKKAAKKEQKKQQKDAKKGGEGQPDQQPATDGQT